MVKRRRIKKRSRRKPEKRNLTFILFAVVIFVGSIAGYALLSGGSLKGGGQPSKEEPGREVYILGNQHVQPGEEHIPYNSDPPTSGPHYTYLAKWGVHNVSIPKELQVHNLEDGGVIIQYDCTGLDENTCEELVGNLSKVVESYDRIILAPYPDMGSVIALTAWGRIDKFNEFDEERIVRFIEAYIGIDHHAR